MLFEHDLSEAGAFPGATRAMQLWYPQPERGFMQGITHSASRLGAAIAPPLVVLIMSQRGWRAVFLICGAIGIFWSLWWTLSLKQTKPGVKHMADQVADQAANPI